MLAFVSVGFSQTEDGHDPEPTTIEFDVEYQDLGTYKEGDTARATFVIKNTGTAPLIIEHVKPPCSCTDTDWTVDPIAPGESGYVKGAFRTKGYLGKNEKKLTIIYNGKPKVKTVRFDVDVVVNEMTAPPPDGDQMLDLGGSKDKKSDGLDNTSGSPWNY